jgi:tetratricopeptide (TPR) repeat protein
VATQSDIDRLIELGLNRYGAGDLDGALLVWEEALAIDPDNPQANSYVDYVRSNYELLDAGEQALVNEPGYAIEEEPEYQIEIQPGELPRESQPVLATDEGLDAGWDLEETHDAGAPMDRPSEENFDEDGTREYFNAAKSPPSDFANEPETSEFAQREVTGSFQNEGTPVGFAQQDTSIRQRELGFVKPQAAPQAVQDKPSSPLAIGTASTIELSALEATSEKNPFADVSIDENENLETKETALPKRSTRDQLEQQLRPPARRGSEELSQAEVMLPHAETRDFTGHGRIDVGAPTRELGLRPSSHRLSNPVDEDAPTGEADVRAIREAAHREGNARPATESTRHDIVLQFDPIAARSAQILDEVDADAPSGEPKDEQTRRRITMLLQRAIEYNTSHETDKAVTAVDLALNEDPNSALGQKLITRNKDTIMQIFQSFIGDLERMPQLAKPLHELAKEPITPRAAFLLSRIDGTLTVDELLDVSGMPRMEAYRHLCQLFLRGILR